MQTSSDNKYLVCPQQYCLIQNNNEETPYKGFATLGVGPCVSVAVKYHNTIALAHLDAGNLQSKKHIEKFILKLQKEISHSANTKDINDIKANAEIHVITGDVNAGKRHIQEFKTDPAFTELADIMLLEHKSDFDKVVDALQAEGFRTNFHSLDNTSVDIALDENGFRTNVDNIGDKLDTNLMMKKFTTDGKVHYHNVNSKKSPCIIF
jgi:hypothetical protein